MRKQVAAFLTTFAALIAGIAFAAWTATGTGSGYAKAKTAQTLSTQDVHPFATATLYPGATGDVLISIVNPNDYNVTVASITGNGAITSLNAPCGVDLAHPTGVTFTDQTGLSDVVPAHSTGTQFTLTGAAHMDNTSDNSCQGATFVIPVSLSGASS